MATSFISDDLCDEDAAGSAVPRTNLFLENSTMEVDNDSKGKRLKGSVSVRFQ